MTTLTKDEVIAMALESGVWQEHTNTWMGSSDDIECFAQLCRADLVAEVKRLNDIENSRQGVSQAYVDELRAEVDRLKDGLDAPKVEPESRACDRHPDAPHGFARNASHSAGRYVCECEGWTPPKDQEIEP